MEKGGYMRRTVLILIAALFAIGIAFKTTPAHAVEGKVGLTMMYDWWKPGFLAFENATVANLYGDAFSDDLEGSFMMGPTLSLGINSQWTFGTTLLFGLSRNEFTHASYAADLDVLRAGILGAYLESGKSKARRYDWDINFDYAFHKYLSLLIGVRFNYADGEGEAFRLGLVGPRFDFMDQKEFSAWYLGPSLGLGFHYEFIKGLVLNVGVSALIQFGQYDSERRFLDTWLLLIPYDYSAGYFCIGLDNNVRLGYLIAPISLEVFIGGRYIVLPHIAAGGDSPAWDLSHQKDWIGGEVEHWGGLYFGAAYKF